MSGDTTQPTEQPPGEASAPRVRDVSVLCVAYCRHEPWRLGEVYRFPDLGIETVLGRGPGEGREVRAELCQQRPRGTVRMPPLADPSMSRQVLLLVPTLVGHDPALEVQLLPGASRRHELRINSQPRSAGCVTPGETIEVRGERDCKLLLYCTRRPMEMSTRYPDAGALGAFGQADEQDHVGESFARWLLRERLIFAAMAGLHVLLHGPSGSGKELAARALHRLSKRWGAFVARNAATFTESIVDQELFGNVRDFPNPRTPARAGLFGEADGGTAFFDEIGEMPVWLQSHLLRAADPDGELTPLGGTPRRCDTWLIAATNRELSALKHDFAARLKTRIELPGLNERREDVPLLVQHLALGFAQRRPKVAGRFVATDPTTGGRKYARVDPALIEVLLRWTYTTHVRELETLLTTAMGESHGSVIEMSSGLPAALERQIRRRVGADGPDEDPPPRLSPEDEEQRLRLICDGSHGSKARAARALGKSRQQIDRLLTKYGIMEPDGGGGDEGD